MHHTWRHHDDNECLVGWGYNLCRLDDLIFYSLYQAFLHHHLKWWLLPGVTADSPCRKQFPRLERYFICCTVTIWACILTWNVQFRYFKPWVVWHTCSPWWGGGVSRGPPTRARVKGTQAGVSRGDNGGLGLGSTKILANRINPQKAKLRASLANLTSLWLTFGLCSIKMGCHKIAPLQLILSHSLNSPSNEYITLIH